MEKFSVSTYAIIENNGKIFVALRKATDNFEGDKWSIPGGKMSFGEDAIDSLKKSVKNQCGLEIDVLSPIDVSVNINEDKKEQDVAITYICELNSGQPKLSKEFKEFKWFDAKKVTSMEDLEWVLEKTIYPYIELISS